MSTKFLSEFCNWGKNKSVCLTIDIDWAPDYMLDDAYNLIRGFSPTLFATHDSPLLKSLSSEVDIGIHPNLSRGSDHGTDIQDAVLFFQKLDYVNFEWLRFHIFGHAYPDLEKLASYGTRIDSSYCLLNGKYIVPHLQPGLDMVMAPYFWEDGLRLKAGAKDEYIDWHAEGLKIFDFHPLDIYFNTPSIEYRNKIKRLYPSVKHIPRREADKLRNKTEFGTRDALLSILNRVKAGKVRVFSFSELNQAVRLLNV